MTKKIFRSILIVAVSVLVLSFAVMLDVLYRSFSLEQSKQLRAELMIAAHGAETGGTDWLKALDADGYRLTLVAADGAVLYDSEADAAAMGNHLGREEIAEALQNGSGESERISSTLTQKMLYQAKRLVDGSVLRISVTQNSVLSLLLGMLTPVCIVLAAAILLSAFLARGVAKRATAPLNALDLEHPLENDAYDELSPLLLRIHHQQRQISEQADALKQRQDELAVITEGMSEGLVLLGETGKIVSMNPAAQRVFGTDAACIGEDFLSVERESVIRRALDASSSSGHGEAAFMRNGRQYEADIHAIVSEGNPVGTAMLVFDTTEKTLAEQQRREFTANVSHELKTPLQSILGSAELLENGLVQPADVPRFVGHIRSEANRLVTLIGDIIRLSQLDEGGALPEETVDLFEIAKEAAASVEGAAAAKHVSLSISGAPASMRGVRSLLYELAYNLLDNAVRYNVDGGTVALSVTLEGGSAVLTVKDSGIGIPLEHQGRVFERFYRVDKSHSKETGGTGLGLSIVKHAVLRHQGEIRLKSAASQGTTVTVVLPRR